MSSRQKSITGGTDIIMSSGDDTDKEANSDSDTSMCDANNCSYNQIPELDWRELSLAPIEMGMKDENKQMESMVI